MRCRKLARTYEHVDPSLVGNERVITISDMSGQSNVLVRAEALGFNLAKGAPEVQKILAEVKKLESEGLRVRGGRGQFELLIRKQLDQHTSFFELLGVPLDSSLQRAPGFDETCEATVKLSINGERVYTVDDGDGPLQGTHSTKAAQGARLADLSRVSSNGERTWGTVGVSTNIIDASWEALVDAIEYYLAKKV